MRPENVPTTASRFDLDSRRRAFEEVSPAILFDEFVEEALELFDRDEKRRRR